MTKHGGLWPVVPRGGMRMLCLLLTAVWSCSGDSSGGADGAGPLVRLHLSPVDTTATSAALNITARDPAGQDRPFAMTFTSGPFDLLGVSFPPGTRGPTNYKAGLYGDSSCLVASGATSLNLDGDGVFELPLAMTAVPLCGNGATLTVQVANVLGGSGDVTSTPAGISCQGGASSCSAAYMKGTQVTLTAQAAKGSDFAGWSGAGCSGIGSCTVTLSQDTQVQAVFTACHGWCSEPLPFPVPVTANLNAISGTAANNILVVGEAGTALRWDGAAWQKLTPPVDAGVSLRAAAGRIGGSVIHVAGDSGTILQFSDGNWRSITNGPNANLRAVAIGAGSAPNTFFVGDTGTTLVLANNGSTVSNKSFFSGTLANILAISQNPNSNSDDLLIVGSALIVQGLARSWDGNNSTGSQMTNPGANISGSINAVLCGTSTFYAVGNQGAIVSRTSDKGASGNANTWTKVTSPTSATLRGIWAASDSNIFAVGDTGTIIHYNGTAWQTVTPATGNTLRAIWGSGPMNIYAVGDSGTILHFVP